MKKNLIIISLVISIQSAYGQFKLLKDIYTPLTREGSNPSLLTKLGDEVIFAATQNDSGEELWKSDGTEEGTVLVKDIRPGINSSAISHLTAVGDWVYFVASSGIPDPQIWKTNGTAEGTFRITDDYYGIDNLFEMDNNLYFTAFFSGTPLFCKIEAASDNIVILMEGQAVGFEVLGKIALFKAWGDGKGGELWKTDGTAAGTKLVKDINPQGNSSNPFELTSMNDLVFFRANDGQHGDELWKTDGTEEGTVLVKDIKEGAGSSGLSTLTVAEDKLFFVADNGADGRELWTSDGTETGTHMIRDLAVGSASSVIDEIANNNGVILFTLNKGLLNAELWRSDGTGDGTTMVRSFTTTHQPPFIRLLSEINGVLYFDANEGDGLSELWRSDGTLEGTYMVEEVKPQSVEEVNGVLFFQGYTWELGSELWKTNGTKDGTVMVKDIFTGTGSSIPLGVCSSELNGDIFFPATDADGVGLWKTDGTSDGTQKVSSEAYPYRIITNLNGRLYFNTYSSYGIEPGFSDGTPYGTEIIADINEGLPNSDPSGYTLFKGGIYLSAYSSRTNEKLGIWKVNSSGEGVDLIKGNLSSPSYFSIAPKLYALDDVLLFTDRNGLISSDGTTEGTQFIKQLNNPSPLVHYGSEFIFTATTSDYGEELWKTDGTASGTNIIKDITPGVTGSDIRLIGEIDDNFHFLKKEGNLYQFWITDGSGEGTQMLFDLQMQTVGSNWIKFNNAIYFIANNGAGNDIWVTDLTASGTHILKDINPGYGNADITSFRIYMDTLYFIADDGQNGRTLWKSDGTEEGTVRVPGLPGSPMSILNTVNNQLLIYVSNNDYGDELWKYAPAIDQDDDGYDIINDCNDNDPDLNEPVIWYADQDKDGYGDLENVIYTCTVPIGYVSNSTDCNDADDTIHPDVIWYLDSDNDGYGDPVNTIQGCAQPEGYVSNDQDCDDDNNLLNPETIWYADQDSDGYGDGDNYQRACTAPFGYVDNSGDCNDTDEGINVDFNWYLDFDNDGYGDPAIVMQSCVQPEGYVSNDHDCDDTNSVLTPENDCNIIAALGEFEVDNNFYIYPNPVKYKLYIHGLDKDESYVYAIFDVNGKGILRGELLKNEIDVRRLKSGVFILSIISSDNSHKYKFVKQE